MFPFPRKPQEHELKFLFPSHRLAAILQWLNHCCQSDPHFSHNQITTIYYDRLDRRFAGEKQNSAYQKTKVRVRWYHSVDEPETSTGTWLEIKHKIGAQRQKLRFQLPYSPAMLSSLSLEDPIMRVEIPEFLLRQGIGYGSLLPMFGVRYERHRFLENYHHLRISVDSELSVPKVNYQLFPIRPPVPSQVAVLEVKGGVTSLPHSLCQLLNLGCVKTSFSKYEMCYQQLLREVL